MSDVATADSVLRFPCKSCGAKLSWKPGAGTLTCEYCDYSEAVPTEQSQVVERPFEDYRPESTGWDTALKSWECKQCGSLTEREPHVTAGSCIFCGSNQVAPMAESPRKHKPESLLPFQVGKDQCSALFKAWVQSLWFRPDALKQEARTDGVSGVYVPFWVFDTLTSSFWNAEAGYYYYETNDKGERQRKVRWEHAHGSYSEYFDDVLARGSSSVEASLAQAIEPFDTKALAPYKPEYLAGYAAEDYRIDMPDAWVEARARIDRKIRGECASRVPGDTHRSLSISSSYLNRTYKLALLPIWISSYRYQSKTYSYIVNGQTGRVSGTAPFSWVKITAFILTLAALIGTIWHYAN